MADNNPILVVDKFPQLVAGVQPYTFNINPYLTEHSLTLATLGIVTENAPVATVGNISEAAGILSFEVDAVAVGCAALTVTGTFTGSTVVRKVRLLIFVQNPEC